MVEKYTIACRNLLFSPVAFFAGSSDDMASNNGDCNGGALSDINGGKAPGAAQRNNTTVHVCWHRNTSIGMTDHLRATEVSLDIFEDEGFRSICPPQNFFFSKMKTTLMYTTNSHYYFPKILELGSENTSRSTDSATVFPVTSLHPVPLFLYRTSWAVSCYASSKIATAGRSCGSCSPISACSFTSRSKTTRLWPACLYSGTASPSQTKRMPYRRTLFSSCSSRITFTFSEPRVNTRSAGEWRNRISPPPRKCQCHKFIKGWRWVPMQLPWRFFQSWYQQFKI